MSEPDRGQTHAINKGMQRATGEIRAYLNSDDYYLPGALEHVAQHFLAHPDVDLVHGGCRTAYRGLGDVVTHYGRIGSLEEILDPWEVWWQRRQFIQPEVFWSARIAREVGPFNETLNWVMDYEYWTRIFLARGKVERIEAPLAFFRHSPAQKSKQRDRSAQELLKVVAQFLWDDRTPLPWPKRVQLQGRWLYKELLLPTVADSVARGESRARRWSRVAGVCLKHPKILAGRSFRQRLAGILRAQPRSNS